MISYLKSFEKHVFGIPSFTFKLYSNIVVPILILLDIPSSERGLVEANFRILNKVSSISTSYPSSFFWNASSNIPSIDWVFL